MSMYSTLEEAIDAAREEFLANHPELEEGDASISQFGLQKYVMQDGDIMWEAEFFTRDGEAVESTNFRSGEAAQAIFDGDYDAQELEEEWLDEGTLYEWDEGEYQYEPPLDTEEGKAAADEWDDEDDYPGKDID